MVTASRPSSGSASTKPEMSACSTSSRALRCGGRGLHSLKLILTVVSLTNDTLLNEGTVVVEQFEAEQGEGLFWKIGW